MALIDDQLDDLEARLTAVCARCDQHDGDEGERVRLVEELTILQNEALALMSRILGPVH